MTGDSDEVFSSGLTIAIIFSESIIFLSLICLVVYMDPLLSITIFSFPFSNYTYYSLVSSFFLLLRQRLQETGIETNKSLLQFFHAFKEMVILNQVNLSLKI